MPSAALLLVGGFESRESYIKREEYKISLRHPASALERDDAIRHNALSKYLFSPLWSRHPSGRSAWIATVISLRGTMVHEMSFDFRVKSRSNLPERRCACFHRIFYNICYNTFSISSLRELGSFLFLSLIVLLLSSFCIFPSSMKEKNFTLVDLIFWFDLERKFRARICLFLLPWACGWTRANARWAGENPRRVFSGRSNLNKIAERIESYMALYILHQFEERYLLILAERAMNSRKLSHVAWEKGAIKDEILSNQRSWCFRLDISFHRCEGQGSISSTLLWWYLIPSSSQRISCT